MYEALGPASFANAILPPASTLSGNEEGGRPRRPAAAIARAPPRGRVSFLEASSASKPRARINPRRQKRRVRRIRLAVAAGAFGG
jgi:hypothetical protein